MTDPLTDAEFRAVLDRLGWNVCIDCAADLRGRRLSAPLELGAGDGLRCVLCCAEFAPGRRVEAQL